MSKTLFGCALALGLTMAAPAMAVDSSTDANTQSLQYFKGDWRCTPQGNTMVDGNDLAVLHVARTMGDWFAVQVIKFGQHSGEALGFMTFDPHENQFVEMGLCDKGSYGKGTAAGWDNGALVFTGFQHHKDGNDHYFRKTFKKGDAGSFSMTHETSQDGKVFEIMHQAVCTR